MLELNKIYCMDCLDGMKQLDDNSVNLIVTSPPYNKTHRTDGLNKLYMEYSDNLPESEYIEWTKKLFLEFKRILTDKGVIVYNFNYSSITQDLPYKLILAIQECGLKLYETVIWNKKNGMTLPQLNYLSRQFEFIWIIAKSNNYLMNKDKNTLIKTRKYFPNNYFSNVWEFNIHFENQFTKRKVNNREDGIFHGAVFPIHLPKIACLLYSRENDVVLDPFMGSGTTALACLETNRKFIGFEITKAYVNLSNDRIMFKMCQKNLTQEVLPFT